jgi:AraC family transcriptional regulator
MSATQFREQKNPNSNICQLHSNIMQDESDDSSYFCFFSNNQNWRSEMEIRNAVEVKELPEMTIAYVRYIGPYKGDSELFQGLWNKLFGWAGPRNLIGGPDFKSLIIYHDNPDITDENKLRTDVCITVSRETEVEGEIGKSILQSGSYAVGRFVVDETEFAKAWNVMYGEWLPKSGYQPDDKPCFEVYPEEPKDGKFTVDICIPVKPL